MQSGAAELGYLSIQHKTLTQEITVGFPFQTYFFYYDLFITIIVCYYSRHDVKGAAYLPPYGHYFRRCSFRSYIYGHILKVGRLFASFSSLYSEWETPVICLGVLVNSILSPWKLAKWNLECLVLVRNKKSSFYFLFKKALTSFIIVVHQELTTSGLQVSISHLLLVHFVNKITNVNRCLSYWLPRLMRQCVFCSAPFYWLYMYSCHLVLKHLNNHCGC